MAALFTLRCCRLRSWPGTSPTRRQGYLERIAARRPLWTFTKYREDELGEAADALDSGRVNCLFVASGAFQGTAVEQSLRQGPLHDALGRHLERGGGLIIGTSTSPSPGSSSSAGRRSDWKLVLGKARGSPVADSASGRLA